MIKKSSRNVALDVLKTKLSTHTKVKHINYVRLKMQPYLSSDCLSQDEEKKHLPLLDHIAQEASKVISEKCIKI